MCGIIVCAREEETWSLLEKRVLDFESVVSSVRGMAFP